MTKFGQPFSLKLDKDKDVLNSKMGAICSILLTLLLIAYMVYKATVLEGRKNVDIIQTITENYFDEHYTFGAK